MPRPFARWYLFEMLHVVDSFYTEERIVKNARQFTPLAGVADLEAGALLGSYSGPLLRTPLRFILFDT